jgi:uncharacterized membrane protein YhaH (DUF805 family)
MNWLLNPITKHYADFKGRATRQEFWMFVLFHFLFLTSIVILLSILLASGFLNVWNVGFVFLLINIGLILPSISMTVRRLHDTGHSGWWVLLGFVPYLGGLVVAVLCALRGQPGTNSYGPSASGQAESTVPTMNVPDDLSTSNPT